MAGELRIELRPAVLETAALTFMQLPSIYFFFLYIYIIIYFFINFKLDSLMINQIIVIKDGD